MNYAVIDWDNTLRQGFALFTWIEYLREHNIFDKKMDKMITSLLENHKSGKVSYKELSSIASRLYSEGIKGITPAELGLQVKNYLPIEEAHMYAFSEKIFNLLEAYDVKAVVVSGSPKIIINEYTERFNLDDIYALTTQEYSGKYTGEVEDTFGHDKGRAIDILVKKYGAMPLLALGDSIADLDLLHAAKYGYWIKDSDQDVADDSIPVLHAKDTEHILHAIRAILDQHKDTRNSSSDRYLSPRNTQFRQRRVAMA